MSYLKRNNYFTTVHCMINLITGFVIKFNYVESIDCYKNNF